MQYSRATVAEVERPAPGYALLRFDVDPPMPGIPGQFVMVRGDWDAHPILPRAFSLVEIGARAAILVRAVGEGTRRLAAMRPGDAATVLGPSGRGFSFPEADRAPVLVAGGVGVAPMVLLAEQLAARGGPAPVTVFGARTAGDLPLRERLAAVGEIHVTTEDGGAGERGLVTAPLARLLADGERRRVYACGPEGMLEAVARACVAAGAPCEVALESPMACGMGTCKGCAVLDAAGEYRYVCSDGPVFDSLAIYGDGR